MSEASVQISQGHRIHTLGRHRTAAPLLTAFLIIAGLLAALRLNAQFFPPIESPRITVTVDWPGASASDVAENVLTALEPDLQILDELDTATGTARAGRAVISLEFQAGTDMSAALANVEQTISRIDTLPATSDPPRIARTPHYEHVASLSVSGHLPEDEVKFHARKIRRDLLALGIDRVALTGLRDEEIRVRLREEDMRRFELSIAELSDRISQNMADLPAGTVEGGVNRHVRFLSNRKSSAAVADIEVKSRNTGEKIFLKDVADVVQDFDRDAEIGFSRGRPAVQLSVQSLHAADTLETMATLERYVASLRPTLPSGLTVEIYDIRGKFIAEMLAVLIANALQGLALVLAALFLLLNWRIAIWVAAGIPVALMATLAVMYATGQTLNVISMLALIMMLGILVDDAIVVGEHVDHLSARGYPSHEAAELGARRMFSPVLVASLTTLAAFLPILSIAGPVGAILSAIPVVVCAALACSLLECFFILPGHLRLGLERPRERGGFRCRFDEAFARFRDGPFRRFLQTSYRWRYTTMALVGAGLVFSLSLVASGHVGFTFFASPEAENITALVEFGAGTPRAKQRAAMESIEQAVYDVENRMLKREPGDRLVETTFATLGKAGANEGRNSAEVMVQLTANESRSARTPTIVSAWRDALPPLASVERITILQRRSGPPGRDIDVRLSNAPLHELKRAAKKLHGALAALSGVSAISDDLPWGEPELILALTPFGSALGFTSMSVGQQVRNAFEGAVATRFTRGDEEVAVRVLRAQQLGGTAGLRDLHLLTPAGNRVSIAEVVTVKERAGFSTIRHEGGVRAVAVTADIDRGERTVPEVLRHLADDVLPGIVAEHGVDYAFAGRAKERAKTFKDLGVAALLAFALIFMILAWGFESYVKPIMIMAVVPAGAIGAILGHAVMGYDVTIISLIGFLGLSGVLVNDSIILLTEIDRRRRNGEDSETAVIAAGQRRLRAVLLTSLTTALGLMPLLFETSRNSQFLKPMAITLVFGLVSATVLVLILMPALAGLGDDLSRMGRAALRRFDPARGLVTTVLRRGEAPG